MSAVANLVDNAVRYTPERGRIEVGWKLLANGDGEVTVCDTGIGIEKEHLPRLTERFYRVDGSRSRDTGGTGLGLSIVKHVVQRHSGELDIQSEPGRGSTFKAGLPGCARAHRRAGGRCAQPATHDHSLTSRTDLLYLTGSPVANEDRRSTSSRSVGTPLLRDEAASPPAPDRSCGVRSATSR